MKKYKILIIKLGYSETLDLLISRTTSLGDVLRTTVILHLFKDDYVTWLVDERAYPLLENNPYINRILLYDLNSVLQLQRERFDTVINLEKVPGLCALADSVNAWRRYGFRFEEQHGMAEAHDGAEYVLSLCKNYNEKKSNVKYWQQFLIEMVGGKWQEQEYILGYKPRSKEQFDVGFNWAVGEKWSNKAWPEEHWKELERLLRGNHTLSWQKGLDDIKEYIEWINSCRLIVTNDSLGCHIAVALKKKTIVLYGPNSAREMFLYNRGEKLTPRIDYDCIPCLSPRCSREKRCMYFIEPKRVKEVIDKITSKG